MDLLEENPHRHLNGFANPGSTGQVWCATDAAVYPHFTFADLHAVHNGWSHQHCLQKQIVVFGLSDFIVFEAAFDNLQILKSFS